MYIHISVKAIIISQIENFFLFSGLNIEKEKKREFSSRFACLNTRMCFGLLSINYSKRTSSTVKIPSIK